MKPVFIFARKPRVSTARLLGLTVFVLGVLLFSGAPVAIAGEACPNEAIRARETEHDSYATRLPDCRAYEQVSPVDKNATDALGAADRVESSPSGDSVSYFSVVPFPDVVGSVEYSTYMSMHGADGWSTQGLLPLTEPYAGPEVLGLTNSNDEAVVYVGEEEGLLLAPGAVAGPGEVGGNLYLRDNLTGTYRLIAAGVFDVTFAGATPDGSRILFSARLGEAQELGGLTGFTAAPELFEWERETGRVSLIGVVGAGAPAEGAVAGTNENGGEDTYDEDALSENGSRVFFSDLGEGRKVYMREPRANRTLEVSEGEAQWRTATPDGSKAFYTEGSEGNSNPDKNLYEYDVEDEQRVPITTGTPGVLGAVGASPTGSYVYFVAQGVLASNENGEKQKAEEGREDANLYEWHEGSPSAITFIATLKEGDDRTDWEGVDLDAPDLPQQGYRASRVSADGTIVLINSVNRLTNYDNGDENNEVYLFDALEPLSVSNPRCVSCNPAGATANYDVFLSFNFTGGPAIDNAFHFLTHNLSAEGTRVFFQTAEALLPGVTDGQENVYEWEREGVGGCGVGEGGESGGCLYLISTGQSTSPSYFGDASENGEDVFFFTRQSLVSQDQDENADIYDAREDGGIAAQSPGSPEAVCEGEACHGPVGSEPAFGAPSSATFSGAGNLAPPAPPSPVVVVKPKSHPRPVKCKKGRVRKKGKCVKKPGSAKRAERSAHSERGAGR